MAAFFLLADSTECVRWDHDPELNELLVSNLLIPWAILAGILSYDGKTAKFRKPSKPLDA